MRLWIRRRGRWYGKVLNALGVGGIIITNTDRFTANFARHISIFTARDTLGRMIAEFLPSTSATSAFCQKKSRSWWRFEFNPCTVAPFGCCSRPAIATLRHLPKSSVSPPGCCLRLISSDSCSLYRPRSWEGSEKLACIRSGCFKCWRFQEGKDPNYSK